MSECVGGALNVRVTTCGAWRCMCRIQSGRQAQHNRWKYGVLPACVRASVRTGIAGVSHVTSRNILNGNYTCFNPTSAKCSNFQLLHKHCYVHQNVTYLDILSEAQIQGKKGGFFSLRLNFVGSFFFNIIHKRKVNICDNLNPAAWHCANSRLALQSVTLHLIQAASVV